MSFDLRMNFDLDLRFKSGIEIRFVFGIELMSIDEHAGEEKSFPAFFFVPELIQVWIARYAAENEEIYLRIGGIRMIN